MFVASPALPGCCKLWARPVVQLTALQTADNIHEALYIRLHDRIPKTEQQIMTNCMIDCMKSYIVRKTAQQIVQQAARNALSQMTVYE